MSVAMRNRIKILEQASDVLKNNFNVVKRGDPEPQWFVDKKNGLLIRMPQAED